MTGIIHLEDTLTHEVFLHIDEQASFVEKVAYTTINWAWTNRINHSAMRMEDKELFIVRNGDQRKTLKLINAAAEKGKDHIFVTDTIKEYGIKPTRKSIERLFRALHRIIPFEPDPDQEQWVRTVNRIVKDQKGNCVDYTTIMSAFLRKLKVPHRIRMAEYPDQARYRSY